jgi:C-terminal processing protease CtpA/Prc
MRFVRASQRQHVPFLWALLAVFPLSGACAAAPQAPTNLDFKLGAVGQIPLGWTLPAASSKSGFTAALAEDGANNDRRCVLLSREQPKGKLVSLAKMLDQGKLTQAFDATPYRGKRVRFRVAARTEPAGYLSQGQFLVRVSAKGGLPSFYDDLADRPILTKEWRDYEILGEVAGDAEKIDLELIFQGTGKAWFDAVRVEVVGRAGEGNEPARPLEGRALDNLAAFTRLLGYVRYFHPSDEAAAADWNALALRGVRDAERAGGPEDLAQILEKLFRPVAPTVRVYPTGKAPAKAPDLAPPGEKSDYKVVYWRHFGVGTGNPLSIYSSTRVNSKDPAKKPNAGKMPKEDPPDPAEPFTADLGAGVSCRIPLALYGDAKGTYPRGEPTGPVKDSRPEGFFPTGNDRASRLAAVALAWNVFQHFYPYFDVVKTDWPGALRKALTAAATDRDERAFLNTLRRMVAALQDGHGRVIPRGFRYQETYRPPIQWDWVEGRLAIVHAADGAWLKPGDVVTKIDGRPATEALAAREELVSGSTPQYRRYVALAELALGAKDSELTLEILSPEGKTRAVKVRRTVPFNEYVEKRPEKITELKPGIFYVDIDRVTEEEFREAVPELAKATGIVFDLRGYPRKCGMTPISYLTGKPVRSGRWHIPVVLYPDREKMQFAFSDWALPPLSPRFKAKTAFLTDGRAISAAETFLGIIEKHNLAEIVGTPTAGTNGNVNPFTVPGGYRIMWTGMKVLKQDGSRHHGVGILPTVPVARTLRGVAEGRDEQLDRAVELMSAK